MTERMTAAEFAAQKAPTENKRVKNATKCVVDGIKFHSKREANRWLYLKAREKAGEITGLERQVPLFLQGRKGLVMTPTGKPKKCVVDFYYVDWKLNGAKIFEDAKGHQTEVSELKLAVLEAQGVKVNLV